MEERPRIVVVGGGVAGLAAAHRITELAAEYEVVVLEAADRAGGLVHTERSDGFVIEHGADAILAEKPWAVDLARRIGLEPQIVRTRPEQTGAYIVSRGKLERVPPGFSLLAPGEIGPFLKSNALTPLGKARALMDLVLPKRSETADESLEAFVTRRFGREMFERLAQPLASGIYGADPAELSLRSTMPRFVEMEETHRSLIRGLRKRRGATEEAASGARYGMFISFQWGTDTLVRELVARLGSRVRLHVDVRAVVQKEAGYGIQVAGGKEIPTDLVIVAVPAWRAAPIVAGLDSSLGARLLNIPYGSSAAVTFGWRRSDVPHPLDAYGFVVPRVEKRKIMASTWASQKWPSRCPNDRVLIRVFLGGAGQEHWVDRDDDDLTRAARAELRELIGVEAEPMLTRVDRYVRAMPHYTLGHEARVAAIDERVRAFPGFALAGNAYRGVGIPDAVRSGELAGESAVMHLRSLGK